METIHSHRIELRRTDVEKSVGSALVRPDASTERSDLHSVLSSFELTVVSKWRSEPLFSLIPPTHFLAEALRTPSSHYYYSN
ncbi:hypothetical protein QR680_007406 [Steinernema hermaphroditum]|uniref:Uncharacterized protein n=1 Tax=Steinernema hermaphroditum TaxID=289476 RepID=A0AA39M640_9BILA|nr:hypothetical protein QR680_007406 [Steinernema hermaphroditum]